MQSQPAAAPASTAVRVCAHCGAGGTTRFCGECGRLLDSIAVPGLLREAAAEVLGVEHGLLGTLRDQMLRPVQVLRAHLDGNADGYVRPLKLFFLLAGAYMLLLSVIQPLTFDMKLLLEQRNPEWTRAAADLIARRGITQEILNERFSARMNTATPLVVALGLLPMAWVLKGMRRERPFRDHVLFMATFSNTVWIVSILSLPLMRVSMGLTTLLVQVISYVYLGVGFFAFYASRTRVRTGVKYAGYVVIDFLMTQFIGLALTSGVLLTILLL